MRGIKVDKFVDFSFQVFLFLFLNVQLKSFTWININPLNLWASVCLCVWYTHFVLGTEITYDFFVFVFLFFCSIQSIPLQDKQLHSSRGIIIANQTLVLQGISKATHGQYMCRATNLQGTVGSNEVYLDVKCKYIYNTIHNDNI